MIPTIGSLWLLGVEPSWIYVVVAVGDPVSDPALRLVDLVTLWADSPFCPTGELSTWHARDFAGVLDVSGLRPFACAFACPDGRGTVGS